ncbi:MAG TPA: thioredoxin fold domain-containing protein [Marinobacterium sp.]|nr:thioredoxin fold domain-containing protein [Marinobacterium sp.]
MKKLIAALALCFSLSAVAAVEDDIRARLQQLDPSIPIQSIDAEALDGFYAVTLASGEVLYMSEDQQFIMSGTLYQVSSQGLVNLTENRLKSIRLEAMKDVKDEDMVIYPAEGERKVRLLVFTDTDCPYCRKLHDEVPELNEMGIEVAYLAFPRSGPGTPTAQKMEAIWCQEGDERLAAMDRAKSGDENALQSCENAVNDQFMLGQRVGVTGTPALIFEDGSLVPGYVPAARLKQMLNL